MLSCVTHNFKISQKNYSDLINSIDWDNVSCSCKAKGSLSVHAYYIRYVKAPFGKIKLRILRVKCAFCLKTHAVIPISIIPYTQRTLADTIQVFIHFHKKRKFNSVFFNSVVSVSPSDIFHLKQIFLNWANYLFIFSHSFVSIATSCFIEFHRNLSQSRFRSSDFLLTT